MEVIHYFLIFLVINLGILYWFQQSVLVGQSSTDPIYNLAKNNFSATVQKEPPTNCKCRLDDVQSCKCRLDGVQSCKCRLDGVQSCQGGAFINNKCRLAGLSGPALGFHQSFSPSVNRELGWRNYFIRKFGGLGTSQKLDTSEYDNGFRGSLTQNYLDSLPNTDNIYRQTDY